jgi:hypothetical protein
MRKTYANIIKPYAKDADETFCSPELQTEERFNAKWQGHLKRNYLKATAFCLCDPTKELKLAIKYSRASDTYWLAKFGLTGTGHVSDCRYRSAAVSAIDTYATDVLIEDPDGTLKVKLEIGLREGGMVKDVRSPRPNAPRPGRTRQPSMRMLGLLHLLWERAGLNAWRPGEVRPVVRIASALEAAGRDIVAGRTPLIDVLLLPGGEGSYAHQNNQAVVKRALSEKLRCVLIAPMANLSERRQEADFEERLFISSYFGMPIARFEDGGWQDVQRRFPRELAHWRNGGGLIVIAQVELEEKAICVVRSAAVMATASAWIPVDSAYEAVVANKLIGEERSFEKPLRFDAEDNEVLPDFILTDTPSDCPLEVFGMATQEYRERMAIKMARYDELYGAGGWWSWDAVKGPVPPPFPPTKGRGS